MCVCVCVGGGGGGGGGSPVLTLFAHIHNILGNHKQSVQRAVML